MRPPLLHTNSSASAHDENTTNTTRATTSTSGRFITPGHTDRVISSTGTTGRRPGGLSRFAGPARRVMAPDPSEGEELLSDLSKGATGMSKRKAYMAILTHPSPDSPMDKASPGSDLSSGIRDSTPVESEPRSYRLSPMSEDPAEESRPSPVVRSLHSHSSVHSLQGHRNSPDPNDKPFRPFHSAIGDLENQPPSFMLSTPRKRSDELVGETKSPRVVSSRSNHARSPLQPARLLPAALPPSSPKHELKPSRPAPIFENENRQSQLLQPQPQAQFQPVQAAATASIQAPAAANPQQAQWTGNTQTLVNPVAVQSTKRSYVVGSDYGQCPRIQANDSV